MNPLFIAAIVSIGLFAGIVYTFRWCFLFRQAVLAKGGSSNDSSSEIVGAIFALLGLLLAFSFSGAYGRFDARRELIVREANAIGTVYLRLDLIPGATKKQLQELLYDYTMFRYALYKDFPDREAAAHDLQKACALQNQIWKILIEATSGSENDKTRVLLLPAVNEMFDITTTRWVAMNTHPPVIIYVTLILLALASSAIAGYRAGSEKVLDYFFPVLFAAATSIIIYLILDIDYPRFGIVRLDNVNHLLADLLNDFGKS